MFVKEKEKSAFRCVKTLDFFTNLRNIEGQKSEHKFLMQPSVGCA